MVKDVWYFIFVLLFAIGLSQCPQTASAQSNPEEPPLLKLHSWYPLPNGHVILEYRAINKYGIQIWRFRHSQKTLATKLPSCNEVTVDGDEIKLITQEANPSLYIIKKDNEGFSPELEMDFTFEHRR